jgi:hypothetical protein
MPAYNQTLGPSQHVHDEVAGDAGLDLDAEIADLKSQMQASLGQGRQLTDGGPQRGAFAWPPRMSGLPGDAARGGYVFIAPWLIGSCCSLPSRWSPLSRSRSPTSQPNQAEPLRLRRASRHYETLFGDRQAWDALLVTTQVSPCKPCPGDLPTAVWWRLMLHSRHLRGVGRFPRSCLPAVRDPVVGRVLIWRDMLNADSRLGQRLPPA